MYYCYISHDKVTQLLSGFEEHEVEELTEKRENKQEKKGSLGLARIFQLISLNVSYGRSDLYHKELKMRENIMQKLMRLLQLISPAVNDFGLHEKLKPAQLYYFTGEFRVKGIDREQNMVAIESIVENYSLILHCSLKYFSSNTDFTKPIEVNSSNYAFLNGLRPVVFETVFLTIGTEDNKIIFGSPLFLLLSDLIGNL